jgi:putative hydroxymethylpyrimidine transport system substrate-binding protein
MRRTKAGYLAIAAAAAIGVSMLSPAAVAAPCDGPVESAKITVMADWLPWASQGPMMAAQLGGYYKDEGLEVEIIAPANPADPIKLVARERVTFSLTYVPEVMLARETGIPVISVAAFMRVLGSGLFYLSDSPVNGVADLKGKIVGVGPKQDAQAFLATTLASAGLTKEDVQVVDPGYAHVPMVVTGKVAAAHGLVFGEGVVADLVLKGEGKPPVKWLLYREHGVPAFYYQLLVGNEDWVEANPNSTCRFLRATQKGTEKWLADPTDTLAVISKGNEAFTPEQHRGIFEATRTHWKEADGTIFTQEAGLWKDAQDWAVEQGLISVPADPSTYFTNDFNPKM